MTKLYRGAAITELVKEAAASVTEANGFDGAEQAATGCRVVAVGRCVNGGAFTVWSQSCTPFDDEDVVLLQGDSNE